MNRILYLIPLFAIIAFVIIFSSEIIGDSEIPSEDTELSEFLDSEYEEIDRFIFKAYFYEGDYELINGQKIPNRIFYDFKNEFTHHYNDMILNKNDQSSAFVVPTLTASAYVVGGFYDYFNGKCSETCLTTQIWKNPTLTYNTSSNSAQVLKLLGYTQIDDLDIIKNPDILNQFERIIVLHNEYVTREMFEAINNHPKVIFLFPNALYAQVEIDPSFETMKLIRGHGYPQENILNGFDWENENTHPFEFDNVCSTWNFYEISNGYMLNCYPEYLIIQDFEFLKVLKNL